MSEKALKQYPKDKLIDLAVEQSNMPRTWGDILTKAQLAKIVADRVKPPDEKEPVQTLGGVTGITVVARFNPYKEDPGHYRVMVKLAEKSPLGFTERALAPYLADEGKRLGEWMIKNAGTGFVRALYHELKDIMDSLDEPVQSAVQYNDHVGRGTIR